MHRLKNQIRSYAWGSATAIPDLLGREPSGEPQAEMWIGAHPDLPSLALMPGGTEVPLDELVARDPEAALGRSVLCRLGPRLPFLAKVLAADQALSLQVHPTLAQAAAGYSAEQEAGVPASAPHRNFKDANHKPETIIALSRFEALCGFREPAEAAMLFRRIQELFRREGLPAPDAISAVVNVLDHRPARDALKGAFEYLLGAGLEVADAAEATTDLLGKQPDLADLALAAVAELGRAYPRDPGVLVSLLLNHVILEPGQALFLPAGNIHAYLRGLGFEVMASSDNVLRGGLTAKHIDIPQLMATVDFATLPVPRLQPAPTSPATFSWRPPFEEFQIEQIVMHPGEHMPVKLSQNGPIIVIVLEGTARISAPSEEAVVAAGETLMIPAAESPAFIAPEPNSTSKPVTAFAVTVGEPHP